MEVKEEPGVKRNWVTDHTIVVYHEDRNHKADRPTDETRWSERLTQAAAYEPNARKPKTELRSI